MTGSLAGAILAQTCRRRTITAACKLPVPCGGFPAKTPRPSNALSQAALSRDPQTIIVNRVLGMAQRLFVARGYHGASMAQIAKESDLSEASLHHYFRHKSDLLQRLFNRIEEEVLVGMAERVAKAGPSAKEKLLALFDDKVLLRSTYLSDSMLRILMSLEFQD